MSRFIKIFIAVTATFIVCLLLCGLMVWLLGSFIKWELLPLSIPVVPNNEEIRVMIIGVIVCIYLVTAFIDN